MGRGIKKPTLGEKIYNTHYSIPRIRKELGLRCNHTATAYLAAIIEYLISEICEISLNAALDSKKKTLACRHIMLAIKSDVDLDVMFGKAFFTNSGVLPHIHRAVLPKSINKEANPSGAKLAPSNTAVQ